MLELSLDKKFELFRFWLQKYIFKILYIFSVNLFEKVFIAFLKRVHFLLKFI